MAKQRHDASLEASEPLTALLAFQDKRGHPLFGSLKDLADDIFRQGGVRHASRESLLASLSPVFRMKRPCSAELQSHIRSAFERRLAEHSKSDRNHVLGRLQVAFGIEAAGSEIRCDRSDFTMLVRMARECVSLSAVVVPEVMNDACGHHVLHEIVARLLTPQDSERPIATFNFLCASESQAIDFWRTLLLEASKGKNDAELQFGVQRLHNLENSGVIKVSSVSPDICLFSAIFMDLEDANDSVGFYFDVYAPSVVSISRMSKESVARWMRSVYLPLRMGSLGAQISLSQAQRSL
ncbi:MAG: hypothetical protein JST30_11455 [Armatimonadetes bacterium]|nr:hypothetical protein [Armatimonadota bacterium]